MCCGRYGTGSLCSIFLNGNCHHSQYRDISADIERENVKTESKDFPESFSHEVTTFKSRRNVQRQQNGGRGQWL